jgi:hypothetical protein
LPVEQQKQGQVEHEPRQTGGFQGSDHALSFDIGIPRSAIIFSMIWPHVIDDIGSAI